MFGIGLPEFLVILVVAVVVIGPKDLPRALYNAGKLVRKFRVLSADIQKSLDAVLHEGELDDIVMLALQKDPGRRYSSVAQFRDDIARYRRGFPILAKGDRLSYRVQKFLRRNLVSASAVTRAWCCSSQAVSGVLFQSYHL